jgi:tetratricopeptide (TPR) repeat protein
VLLSNRGAAYLSNGEKSKALHDAQACIQSSPEFAKGHSRLAVALQSLGQWGQAKEAYQKVLELDKDNAAAKKGYEDCRLKEEENSKEVEATKKEEDEQDKQEEEKDLLRVDMSVQNVKREKIWRRCSHEWSTAYLQRLNINVKRSKKDNAIKNNERGSKRRNNCAKRKRVASLTRIGGTILASRSALAAGEAFKRRESCKTLG